MKENIHGGDIYSHKNVIDYSANCNPFGVPRGVAKAICEAAERINHYPDVNASELRKALSEHIGVAENRIFFGSGAAEVIFNIAFGLKPKKALLTAPSFAEYKEALDAAGTQIEYYRTYEEKGYEIQDNILDFIEDDLDIMFICNPNNPTGTLASKGLISRVAEKCREKSVVLVVDECFMDFTAAQDSCSVMRMIDNFDNIIILKAFTKIYAMAGVRLGYCLCANSSIMEALDKVRQPWNLSNLAQSAGMAALKEEQYVKDSLKAVNSERKRLIEALSEMGFKIYGSKANYIFFKGREDLYERALEKGFLIRDCSNYEGLDKGYYRIAVKLAAENDKLLDAFKSIIND